LLAHTLFAQGDNTVAVRKYELLFMWSMVNDFHLDSGTWLAHQLTKVGKASSGNIAIDGLITTIALHFNIPFEDNKPMHSLCCHNLKITLEQIPPMHGLCCQQGWSLPPFHNHFPLQFQSCTHSHCALGNK